MKIKNFVFSFFVLIFLVSASSADNIENSQNPACAKAEENKDNSQMCERCVVEDDEYCIYNQCYFDKQFRTLKTAISPNTNQENQMDNIYLNFKQDLELQCDRYLKAKNKLLELIALDDKCFKEQKREVKYIKNDIKEKFKDYLSDTNEILCGNQKSAFRKFKRKQNRKIRQIKKYGAIYKFPCP